MSTTSSVVAVWPRVVVVSSKVVVVSTKVSWSCPRIVVSDDVVVHSGAVGSMVQSIGARRARARVEPSPARTARPRRRTRRGRPGVLVVVHSSPAAPAVRGSSRVPGARLVAPRSALVRLGRSRWCARRWSGAGAVRRRGGSVAPRTRASWRSPVWLPPRLVSSRIVRPRVRCSTRHLVAVERRRRPARVEPGAPEDLVGQQVAHARPRGSGRAATPSAVPGWRRARPAARRSRTSRASTPRWSRRGSSTTPPRRRGIDHLERAAAVEAEARSASTSAPGVHSSTRASRSGPRRRRAAGRSSRSAARASPRRCRAGAACRCGGCR